MSAGRKMEDEAMVGTISQPKNDRITERMDSDSSQGKSGASGVITRKDAYAGAIQFLYDTMTNEKASPALRFKAAGMILGEWGK